MPDEAPVEVEAYAGGSYPGHPRAVTWLRRRYAVAEVIAQWLTPRGPAFRVECRSGPSLILHYIELDDTWQARAVSPRHLSSQEKHE